MALQESQCDIINAKIYTIFVDAEKLGKNLSEENKNHIIWYFQFRVNHKGETYEGTLNTLDKLISKLNAKNVNIIINGLVYAALSEYAMLLKMTRNEKRTEKKEANTVEKKNEKVLVKKLDNKENI